MSELNIVVTAANSKYFQLLKGLIVSISPQKVAVLDLGLEDYEKDWITEQGCFCVEPRPIIGTKEMRPSVLGYVERPSITQLVPGYEKYLWLDCDIWAQDKSAIQELFDECDRYDVCVVPEVDRSFTTQGLTQSVIWKYQKLEQYYGDTIARELSHIPMFNSGVVAARVDSKIWELWATALVYILMDNPPDFGVDQISLNFAIGKNEIKTGMFSPLYNWTCHLSLPIIKDAKLVEPSPPYNMIKLVHLSANIKNVKHPIKRFDGNTTDVRHLDYWDFNGS